MKKENQKLKQLATKVGVFLNNHMTVIAAISMICIMILGIAYAADADTLWTTVADLIKRWVTRLGGVVMFVGGIMFALGWKSDDAEQKSRGVSTMVSGAIVIAIAGMAAQFFA